jgi:cell division protein FtsW
MGMPRKAHVLEWVVLSLLGLAVLVIHSARMRVDSAPMTAVGLLTSREAIYAGAAVLLMLLVGRLDIRNIYRGRLLGLPYPVWGVLVAGGLCVAALVPGVGAEINGSRRWLSIGAGGVALTFQPSELAKWATVLAMAWWAARRAGAMRRFMLGLAPALVVMAGLCGLIVVEDLGTAVLIAAVALAMLLAGGARWWHVAGLIPLAGGAFAAAVLQSPYRLQRLTTFLDPAADPRGAGYQPIQMMAAIAEGGRGWGNGIIKQGYLPAHTTDGIFAIICEELGLAGAAAVIGLFLVLIWAIVGVVRDSRAPFGRLLALGVMMTVAAQAIMNLAVVTVVVPTKGIALPLLSRGGTGWLVTAAALGLVAAIDRLNAVEAEAADQMPTDADVRPFSRAAPAELAINASAVEPPCPGAAPA